jgi:AraC family transcriptional regulator
MLGAAALSVGDFRGEPVVRKSAGSACLASWTARGGGPYDRHQHLDAHFMFVTSGRYSTEASGEVGPSGVMLMFNPAGTEHEDHFEIGGSFFTVSLTEPEAIEETGLRLPPRSVVVGGTGSVMLARRLLRELGVWGCDSASVANGLVLDLAASMQRSDPSALAPGWLRLAREYLNDTCCAPFELNSLAAEAGVHPVHLTRAFRRQFGATPGEYHRARRLQRCAHLLVQTGLPLVEVALTCGFADQAHFTHRFTAAYGVSPAAFRRRTRD